MELRHIRYFLEVAEEGSFTRAAERIGIGQPPLSQQIKALEREVGTQLFRRLPHGAELTEAGRVFRDKVADIPGQTEEAMHLARKAAAGESGILRIGFTGTSALNPLVPDCIRAFQNDYPDVEIAVTEATSNILIKALLEDRMDLAILRPALSDPEELQEEPLVQETLYAALPASHDLNANDGPVDLKDLAKEPFILTPRSVGTSLHDATLEACAAAGFAPKLGPPASQIVSILSLVAAEFGVALVPSSMARINVHGVALRPLKGAVGRVGLCLAYKRGTTAVLTRNFSQVARKQAEQI